MRSVPKSAFGLMQKLSKCVRHAKEKRRKRKERPFSASVCDREKTHLREELKQECHSAIVRKTQVRALGGAVQRDREKHSESVRE